MIQPLVFFNAIFSTWVLLVVSHLHHSVRITTRHHESWFCDRCSLCSSSAWCLVPIHRIDPPNMSKCIRIGMETIGFRNTCILFRWSYFRGWSRTMPLSICHWKTRAVSRTRFRRVSPWVYLFRSFSDMWFRNQSLLFLPIFTQSLSQFAYFVGVG